MCLLSLYCWLISSISSIDGSITSIQFTPVHTSCSVFAILSLFWIKSKHRFFIDKNNRAFCHVNALTFEVIKQIGMARLCTWLFFAMLICSSCSVIRETPKYQFADGYYKTHIFIDSVKKAYVDNEADTIYIYPIKKTGTQLEIDTSTQKRISFAVNPSEIPNKRNSFRQGSLDIDFLTIPFKYRFSVQGFPKQFNTNLNGAVYLGYRSDVYSVNYKTNPLGKTVRETTHYGFSFGLFSGLGGTTINPSVTNNQLNIEYDGVVWSKGVACIFGLDNYTIGLALGWDNLLDNNRNDWIYYGKPWFGLAFGLNIN